MYPLTFLNTDEVDELRHQVDLALQCWITAYTFTRDVIVEFSSVRLNDFVHMDGVFFCHEKSSDLSAKICDRDFNWQRFIFGDQLADCPQGKTLNAFVDDLKVIFFKEVFGVALDDCPFDGNVVPAIDAYLHLRVSSTDIGAIDFFASHSFFALLSGKDKKYPAVDLESRENAMRGVRIPLTFSLAFGDVSFESLLRINVGSVFVSEATVDNSFSMSVCDSSAAIAAMGKRKDKLAFLLKSKE